MNFISAGLNHAQGILSYNFTLDDNLSKFDKIKKGLAAIDTLAGTKLNTPLVKAQETVFPTSTFSEKISNTHDVLLIALAPIVIKKIAEDAKKQFSKATQKNLPTFIRVYNAAIGVLSLSDISIVSSGAIKDAGRIFSLFYNNPTVSKVATVASSILFKFFAVSSFAGVIASIMELKQISILRRDSSFSAPLTPNINVDATIYKECFGTTCENLTDNTLKIKSHILKYQKMKRIQTVNNIVNFATFAVFGSISFLAPFAPIVFLGSMIVKTGLKFWWNRKVTQFKTEMNMPLDQNSDSLASKVARVVSLVALPFLAIKQTAPFAGITIMSAIAADIWSQTSAA